MGKRGRKFQLERKVARDTPDEIQQVFDLESPSFRVELTEWLRQFQRAMRIKHGSSVEVDVKHSQISGQPSVRLVRTFVKEADGGVVPDPA